MKDEAAIEQELIELMNLRMDLANTKREGEAAAKTLHDVVDPSILKFMRDHDIARFEHDGHYMKETGGRNTYISDKLVIKTLSDVGWDPDQIQWFLLQVTKETPYSYVDIRRMKGEDKG